MIIDDHRINRLYLKTLLEDNFPGMRKIDEAGTVSEAVFLMESVNYDVVFLDMELKDGTGFDVLKEVKDFIYVIVVTHHKEYAIQAIKHNVVDYLLKPIDIKEVRNAVRKVIMLQQKYESVRNPGPPQDVVKAVQDREDSLMINYKNQYIALDRKDIVFIKALGKYSEIHVSDKYQYTSYKNLKEFETAMSDIFVRIHHSYLVNLKYIVSYSRETSHVKLSNGVEIPVSVRKRDELFKKFRFF